MASTTNNAKIPDAAAPKEEEDLSVKWLNEIQALTEEQIRNRTKDLENNIQIMKREMNQKKSEITRTNKSISENKAKIKMNKQLPYLVSNIVEILDIEPEEGEDEDTATVDINSTRQGKAVVVKTSTKQSVFLPVVGLVDAEELKPGEIVGVNKDSFLVLEKLPAEYDNRVKAMEVDERPTEKYTDVGGLDKQIEELREAIVLPITHKHLFENIGIRPPKGVLMFGPPGTGKTMMARACAADTSATFLKLAGPQLVQMFIGDGAKMIRDAFALAREKQPAIIFIDELDAIGTKRQNQNTRETFLNYHVLKRFDSDKSGDREVQRTMLELLNQLDGFSPNDNIKVIAATNRPDILDPALLRSGRLDRKIEFPLPNEESRAQVMKIHSRKMTTTKDINFSELARSTTGFNCAQMKAVCVEAGMCALRRGASFLNHEDFVDGIAAVEAKKKEKLEYFA